jgi:hypothetical protein
VASSSSSRGLETPPSSDVDQQHQHQQHLQQEEEWRSGEAADELISRVHPGSGQRAVGSLGAGGALAVVQLEVSVRGGGLGMPGDGGGPHQ